MAFNGVVFAGGLANINVAASGALLVLKPLLAGVDQALFGNLGLAALRDSFQVQLNAALSASVSINVGLLNPLVAFQQALFDIAKLQADILRALSQGLVPSASVSITTQLSALASLAASLQLQIADILALLQALLAAKIPAFSFAGSLSASLSAGDAFLLSFDQNTTPITLAGVGAAVASSFSSGLVSGPASIAPFDPVYGIVIVTKLPSTWTALQAILLT